MERRPIRVRPRVSGPLRRWTREIVLAVALTAVAAAFIANALLKGKEPSRERSAYETARKLSDK